MWTNCEERCSRLRKRWVHCERSELVVSGRKQVDSLGTAVYNASKETEAKVVACEATVDGMSSRVEECSAKVDWMRTELVRCCLYSQDAASSSAAAS